MLGMNAFFHLFAALLTIFLIAGWLQCLSQRDFLRSLLAANSAARRGARAKVYVATPEQFLSRFALALGTRVEGRLPKKLPLRRISQGVWLDLHLDCGIDSIVLDNTGWEDQELKGGVVVYVRALPRDEGQHQDSGALGAPGESPMAVKLAQALGGDLGVRLERVETMGESGHV